MTETGSTVERLHSWVGDWELSARVGFPTYPNPSALKADIRLVLAVVEAAQEMDRWLSFNFRVAYWNRPKAWRKALAALHSQASDEGKA